MLSLFKSTQSVGACMPNNLGYRQDRISYPWLCKHRIMIRVLDNVLWVSSLMDIQNANRTCSFYHRKQTHHIKRSIPGSNAWIPKVAHIWTHLIFKLKMSPYSHILTHNKFMIFLIFYFLDLTIKSHSIEKLSSWIYIQDISSIFSNFFILSITNHYVTNNLSVLQYCFCVSSLYTHDQNFKHQKQWNNINDQLSFLWWYNNTLQTSSGLPCCSRE